MKSLSLLSAALSLALPLLSPARPATAAEVKVIAQAVGSEDPIAISWMDSADGKLSVDEGMSETMHTLFAGAQYLLTDDGRLLLGYLKENQLKPLFPAAAQIHNEKQTFFVAHLRSQERDLFLDGSVTRYANDPTRGYGEFTVLFVGKQGETISTHIGQDLVFAGPGGNTPQ